MASRMEVLADASPEAIQALTGRRILLAGETVFAGLQAFVPDKFVRQAPREAEAGLFSQFGKNVKKVHISVDERLFDIPRVRFAIAMEGYIAWGLRDARKGTTVLFGGAETPRATNVTILVFANGQVVEIDEKVLPPPAETYFRDALTALLGEMRLKYPTARVVQAAPLSEWQDVGVVYVGEAPIKGVAYRPLTRSYSQRSAFVLPAAVVLCGALFYVGAIASGWSSYSSAVGAYDEAMADPAIRNQGGIDVRLLDAMTARRQYMEQPRRQAVLAEKTAYIVKGIGALSGVQILELKLPAPSINPQQQFGVAVSPDQLRQRQQIAPDRSPDVWLSVAVPKTAEPAINQAKAALTVMANSTGMSLRLDHAGWRDEKSRRVFFVEGFIHD